MNGLEFASSLITHIYWPIVVGAAIVIFRKPLAELIGRIKSYKGMGQELTFGDRLAGAENSVEEAVRSIEAEKKDSEQNVVIEPSGLAREADDNPSFVVIYSWEQLAAALADLIGTVLPGGSGGSGGDLRGNQTRLLWE